MPLEFLDAPQGVDTAVAPEVATEPQAEPALQAEPTGEAEAVARGPDGKFVARQPAPEPQAQPEPAAATPEPQAAPTPQVPPGHVPYAALAEARDRLRAAEARAEAAERRQAPAQQPQAHEPPDRYADPEAFDAWRDQQIENRLFDERCNVSERFARTQHGPELVDEAKQWAVQRLQSDPLFGPMLRSQPDPYGFAVAEYRKDKLFSDFKDDDFAAFQAWRAQQGQAHPTPTPSLATASPLPQPAPSPPPRSIATAPSAGGPASVPSGPGQAYDRAFHRG